jgi:hypothetical protein
MLVVRSELVEEVLASFNTKGIGVLSEVAVLEHVIDVVPNRFEGNPGRPVIIDNIFRLTPVLVTLYYWSAYVIPVNRASIIARQQPGFNVPNDIGGSRNPSRAAWQVSR